MGSVGLIVQSWLLDAAFFTTIFLFLVAAATGLALLVHPDWLFGRLQAMNTKVSARRALKPLEVPHYHEQAFYRHHRMFGALIVIGVVIFYALYLTDFPRQALISQIALRYGNAMASSLVTSLESFFVGANALIGLLGLVIIFRPSMLKPIEAVANRWISTRQALRTMGEDHGSVDTFSRNHPRIMGTLILFGALYIGLAFLYVIQIR